MPALSEVLTQNRRWADKIASEQPEFFPGLAKQQTPEYLWLGCSDSRVPPSVVTDMAPGNLFVHRNIANVVVHTDLNFLSVLEYAVAVLQVKSVVVCGHYGCGGVQAAMDTKSRGLIDNWLRHIKDVYLKNSDQFAGDMDEGAKFARLCELNVAAQVANLAHTTIVQNAWKKQQELTIYGVIYDLKSGYLKDLDVAIQSPTQLAALYRIA